MRIDTIRVYSEVLEQGIDFKEYIREAGYSGEIINIYTKKARKEFTSMDSLVDRIRIVKDVDVLITAISEDAEYPLLLVEYSTAVPTDDHKMQRSDVYFWSSIFGVPMMKISPNIKGMDQQFGGGDRLTDQDECSLAYSIGAVLYQICWETPEGFDVLPTKENALSCIYHSDQICYTLKRILNAYNTSDCFEEYFDFLKIEYYREKKDVLYKADLDRARELLVESSRFHWEGNKLCVKINRFGHAMDPDRGVLYFVNMLLGAENTIAEIQVNRSGFDTRGGYYSLFDALGREAELIKYVRDIYRRGNKFTDSNALYIFAHALSIENDLVLEKVGAHQYRISDENLLRFLNTHSSMTSKSIFYLSTELRLTDCNRKTICSIKWGAAPILRYLSQIATTNLIPIKIAPLTYDTSKEDIVTYASVELYKRLTHKLLAVSYPGAQGDRCILTGSGRSVLRTYVDIISYKEDDSGVTVFLEECKDSFSKSAPDVKKLIELRDNPEKTDGLSSLFEKTIGNSSINELYISVGAKVAKRISYFDVDYMFMFDIIDGKTTTNIKYMVAVINKDIIPLFEPLASDGRRLVGEIAIDKIYTISE